MEQAIYTKKPEYNFFPGEGDVRERITTTERAVETAKRAVEIVIKRAESLLPETTRLKNLDKPTFIEVYDYNAPFSDGIGVLTYPIVEVIDGTSESGQPKYAIIDITGDMLTNGAVYMVEGLNLADPTSSSEIKIAGRSLPDRFDDSSQSSIGKVETLTGPYENVEWFVGEKKIGDEFLGMFGPINLKYDNGNGNRFCSVNIIGSDNGKRFIGAANTIADEISYNRKLYQDKKQVNDGWLKKQMASILKRFGS